MSDACNYTRRLLGRRAEEECANSGARLFDQREGTEIYETSWGRRSLPASVLTLKKSCFHSRSGETSDRKCDAGMAQEASESLETTPRSYLLWERVICASCFRWNFSLNTFESHQNSRRVVLEVPPFSSLIDFILYIVVFPCTENVLDNDPRLEVF